jgi:Alpha/beta hydrolase domain/MBG domain (YGX type)
MGAIRLALLALFSLAISADVAFATAPSPTVTAAVGVPTAGAPTSTLFPLASVGYQAAEFFLAGNASSYHNAAGQPYLADGLWTIEADAATAPYKTRVQVYRPIDPATFNGTVYVEWLNVTNLSDTAADWTLGHVEMIREGAAYVGVTTQLVGWNAAVNADPDRYGPAGANLIHPGDSYSYDIFSQAGQALHDNAALILDGLAPAAVIAFGESQSATRMVTYIDALHPLHDVYDGYMVHSRGSNGAQLRGTPPGPNIGAPGPTLIRADLGVPVFVFQSETDTRGTRQPDTGTFRQWEVPGSAHADMYTLGIGQFDDGTTNTAPLALFDRMLNPTNEPLPGILPPCTLPLNSGPHHWTFQAATHALNEWVRSGTPPPTAPVLATMGAPTTALVLDANGNATGGVRTPHVDTPVAAIRGTGNSGAGGFCGLFGTTTPLTTAQLQALYTKQSLFVAAWNQATDNAVANGWIVAADAPRLKPPAALRQVVPKLPLSVTADYQLVPTGAPDPAFTATIDGFVLSDTAATLDTPPTCGVAGPHSAVGTYPITCSGGADDDYSFAYFQGTLEVTYSISGGGGCGIGPELALLVPALAWLRGRGGRKR